MGGSRARRIRYPRMSRDHRARLVTFEGSDRVERIRAEAYRSVPPLVEFVVAGEGLDIHNRVVATSMEERSSRSPRWDSADVPLCAP
jgi:hypothetical protein